MNNFTLEDSQVTSLQFPPEVKLLTWILWRGCGLVFVWFYFYGLFFPHNFFPPLCLIPDLFFLIPDFIDCVGITEEKWNQEDMFRKLNANLQMSFPVYSQLYFCFGLLTFAITYSISYLLWRNISWLHNSLCFSSLLTMIH